ncbi:MAG: glycoside hydrolase family 2 TIM barrel-domain containing protein [Syntrophomonadaceae bacterium]
MKRITSAGTLLGTFLFLGSFLLLFNNLFSQVEIDINKYIEDPMVFSENEEEPAALLVPFENLKQASEYHVENSGYYISLNGKWKFDWKINPSLTDKNFYKTDFRDSKWNEINVPSVWQMQGYDHLVYRNVPMEFYPYNPPKVPDDINPAGCYRKVFEIPLSWQGRRTFIHFYGVQSAMFLWVNGEYIGYHEDGMTSAEFDITNYVKSGKNTVAAMVLRWCDGSYLEDQDMFRYSGIYRDVFVYSKPQTMMKDIFIKTDLDKNYENAELIMDCTFRSYNPENELYSLRYTLMDKNGESLLSETTSSFTIEKNTSRTFTQKVSSPLKWSDEKPNLYILTLELLDKKGSVKEVLSQRVGFRKLEIKDGIALLNGRKIYIRGTNRHEHNPDNGKTLTLELMKKDISLLKRFNLNAIRTSHYPNDPRWYDLCDEYGIFLQDEVNAECHFTEDVFPHRPEYRSAFMNRFERMVFRDKNHPSVIMWSTGNECGLGEPHFMMAQFVKKFDPGRFLMHQSNHPDGEAPYVDIIGPRYPTPSGLRQIGLATSKPVVMGEYAHLMGNSAGHQDEFWETIYEVPRLQGGFYWDFVDQGLNVKARFTKDYSQNNIQTGVMGRPEIVKGLEGSAFKLSGLDDWIEVYDDERLDIRSTALTIDVTLFPQQFYQENPIVTKAFQYGILQTDVDSLAFYINSYKNCVKVKTPSDWYSTWHKVEARYDGQEMTLFIDGKNYGSRKYTSEIKSAHYPVNVGRDAFRDTDQHLGWISNFIYDEVKIYNALSPEKEHMNPVLYLKLDEITEGNNYLTFGISPFCINGMVTADRKPQPEMWQIKHSLSPVRFISSDPSSGLFTVQNKYSFTNLDEFDFVWQLYKNGSLETSGSLNLSVPPQSEKSFQIAELKNLENSSEYVFEISCRMKNSEPFREKGFEVNFQQYEINKAGSSLLENKKQHGNSVAEIKESTHALSVGLKGTEIIIDKASGSFNLFKNGKSLIHSMNANVWRAPISNEKFDWGKAEAEDWYKMGLNEYQNKADKILCRTDSAGNAVIINVKSFMNFSQSSDVVINEFEYVISGEGTVEIKHKMTPLGAFHVEWLPCMGLNFQVPDEYQFVSWYGHGPYENYSDRNTGYRLGTHSVLVDSVMNPYIEPQEYGNYSSVKWFEVKNKEGQGFRISGMKSFDFSAVPYYNLDRARYLFQMFKNNFSSFNLNYGITGVGDTPNPVMPQYRVYPQVYSNRITITPVNNIVQ